MTFRLPLREDLSPEQLDVISLPLDRSHLVTGPPGSGKTVMAVYRAHALERSGEPTVLLMFGKLLSNYIRSWMKSLELPESTVSTYHSWFPAWFKSVYGVPPPKVDRYNFDWQGCVEIVGNNPPPTQLRRHVIVDEGQDMPPWFYAFLRLACRTVTVFADQNQVLTESNSTIAEIRSRLGLRGSSSLPVNFRNTPSIARLAEHFWTGAGDPPVEVKKGVADGDVPVLFADSDLNETVQRIARYEKVYGTQQIGVLVQRQDSAKKLYNRLSAAGRTASLPEIYIRDDRWMTGKRQIDFGKPGLKVMTWRSAKGLEFDTVFAPELQEVKHSELTIDAFRMQMYVVTTRARRDLFLGYSGAGRPAVLEALPLQDLDDWR